MSENGNSANSLAPDSWLSIPEEILGSQDPSSFQQDIENRVASRIAQKKYSAADQRYIRVLDFSPVPSVVALSEERLEMLRRLCQLWHIDLRPQQISSHRPFIGPVIVAAKKLLSQLMRVLLRDFIRQQRDFNAAAVALLSELSVSGSEGAVSSSSESEVSKKLGHKDCARAELQ